MKGRPFSAAFLDRTMVNMTLCFELEEQTDEEGASNENCSGELDKSLVYYKRDNPNESSSYIMLLIILRITLPFSTGLYSINSHS